MAASKVKRPRQESALDGTGVTRNEIYLRSTLKLKKIMLKRQKELGRGQSREITNALYHKGTLTRAQRPPGSSQLQDIVREAIKENQLKATKIK